jgi:hypothetical protein
LWVAATLFCGHFGLINDVCGGNFCMLAAPMFSGCENAIEARLDLAIQVAAYQRHWHCCCCGLSRAPALIRTSLFGSMRFTHARMTRRCVERTPIAEQDHRLVELPRHYRERVATHSMDEVRA